MVNSGTFESEKPVILWVDDDPLILSSARRLLSFQGFEVITTENPKVTLDLLAKHNVSVLVSDQRMPEMTGIEVLKQAKEKFPMVTRLMVTGFYDKELLEEAINTSGVFRFITKPWTEQELISDIRQAVEHVHQIRQNQKLTHEIRQQNKILTQLTENLESIIFERTKEINQSNKDQESKNKYIRNLVHFIQDLQRFEDLTDLLNFFLKDMKSHFKIETLILCYKDFNSDLQMLFSRKNEWNHKQLSLAWSAKNEIRMSDKNDQQYLVENLKRPVHKILSFPLLRFRNNDEISNTLFIEHGLDDSELNRFMDYMTSKLQILSLAIDRIIYLQKIEFDSKQWEYTFDSVQNPICIVDRNGEKLKINNAFKKLIGNLDEIETGLLKKVSETGNLQTDVTRKESQTFEVICLPIRENQQNDISHFVIYYRDITEERALYEKMIQNEKMAALGLLAGNIAHELNNPLTGIRSLAQILKNEDLPKEYISDLQEIDKASERCQNVIQGLKDFSSTQNEKSHLEKVSLNEVVQKTLPLLKSALRHHQMQLNLAKTDIKIVTDPRILQQILFNLIINACQAFKKPGTIMIRTEKRGVSGILEIQDDGPGIPDEIQDKIFEPFFTTKKEGEGTGLGLSFSKNMMEKMGGQITFESKINRGTVFKLKIPTQLSKK